MASITSQLIVELLDRVSAPARGVASAVGNMNRRITEATQGTLTISDRVQAAMTRNDRALAEARMGIADTVAAFYTLREVVAAPIQSAMQLETALSGIGSKAGLSADQLARMRDQLRAISSETNQMTADLAGGIDYLVGMGMSAVDANAAIKTIGTASTATGANIKDMSAASFAAMSNLKVPATELMTALDAMASAGKRGGFELKDMAQYFPSVGAAYAALGQRGTGAVADLAAALQVMRADTGDASSAATNLQNVIQKIYAPATVRKFGEKNIDIFKEMEAAAARGLTPLEAVAEITNRALDGDLSKIGFLFEDAQAQAGVRSLIQRIEEFRRIREEAMGADGTNQADFDRVMDTSAAKAQAAKIAFDNFKESLGSALLPVLRQIAEALTPVLDGLARFTEANPGLVAAIAGTTAGFIALRGAMAGLTFLGLLGKGGALSMMAFAVDGLGGAMGRMGQNAGEMVRLQTTLAAMAGTDLSKFGTLKAAMSGMALAAPGVGTLVTSLSGLGALVATVSLPVWGTFAVAAAAIGAAGFVVYRYWDRITSVMSGVGSAIADILSPALETVRPVLDWFAPLGDTIASGWQAASNAISQVGTWLGTLFQQETLTEEDKEAARKAGYDFVMAIWDGMKSIFTGMTSWFSSKIDGLIAKARSLGSAIQNSFKGSEGVSSDPMGTGFEANAKGGAISRGGRYLVGEKGPELITASRSGYVQPNHKSFGGGSSINLGGITVNAAPGMDPMEIARMVRREIETMTQQAFRSVHADTGLAVYS